MKQAIFIFTTSYRPFIGGAEIAVQEITRRLKDRFDFCIITSRFRRDLPKKEIGPEGKIIRVGMGFWFDKWILPLSVFWHSEFGMRGLQKPENAVLLGVDISTGALAAALLKIFRPRARFIFNIQYGYGEERLKRGRFGLIGLIFKFILKHADSVAAISTHLLEVAREYGYRGPAEVIPNGVDAVKFRFSPSRPKKDTIITVSRLVSKNGVDVLLKATAEVRKKIPDVRCLIIGGGPQENVCRTLIADYGLHNNAKLLGEVPYEDVPKYLRQADIFVRPSRSEGMGNSFVEALAAGLPVIGTPVGGITDIIEDGKTGLFAEVDNPKDLADKIMRLLSDRVLASSIAENGRKTVEERFLWDKIAERYETLMRLTRFNLVNSDRNLGGFLKILIATPLYPPQLGGPALYAKNLADEFRNLGHTVATVNFGDFLKYRTFVRHFLYFRKLWKESYGCGVVFSLDYFSAGVPAALVSFLRRKPLVLRLEGDFLWENFVESCRKDITLSGFYRNPPPLSFKLVLVKFLNGLVVKMAAAVSFSSEWRRKMVAENFGISAGKTVIIKNIWDDFAAECASEKRKRIVIWAGRMLYLKNLRRLLRAFSAANDGAWELHLIGEGTEKDNLEKFAAKEGLRRIVFIKKLAREDLLKKYCESAFFVLPSLSDVGPNVIADAVMTGTPFVMTGESGFAEHLREIGLFVNPLDEKDISVKIKTMMNDETRAAFAEKIAEAKKNLARGWEAAAKDWIELFLKFKL